MNRVKKVVIVGGGTGGWMAAAAFSKLLGKNFELTLVESDEISTVGVGEATVPPLHIFHKLLGIDEQEFMATVKGTFKLGIYFDNWRNINDSYIHSFGVVGQDSWAAGFQHFWYKGLKNGHTEPFGDYCLEVRAAEEKKFAHLKNGIINYAYHMDAGLYAKFLRKIAEEHGTRRVEGKITRVETNHQTGFIESVVMESGEVIDGDLFIDCSGFRALLIEQTLHTGFEDWSHWLPCDSAWAVQMEAAEEPVPYTRAIAYEAGWQWRIPLQHRVGTGFVYCSRYISDEDAKKKLMDSLEGRPIVEPRLIKFKAGQRLKYWNKNCIALGLASGFIEPLESTSIHLIQRGITRLLRMFPLDGVKQSEEDEYNAHMKAEIHNIRDFIILHYHLTEREDSRFWRYCKNMPVPESLAHKIRLFKETGNVYVKTEELFREPSWLQVLMGQGLMPKTHHAIVNQLSDEDLASFLRSIRTPIKNTVEHLPSHQDYLNFYCKAGDWDKM